MATLERVCQVVGYPKTIRVDRVRSPSRVILIYGLTRRATLDFSRIEQVIEPQSTVCPCCGKAMHVIGEERSERLDKIPAVLRVIVTRRPKYACNCGETVAQAPAPPRLIEGGIPTEALIADVVVSKYANHLPLYRQAQIFSRQGIPLDRSTLAAWVGAAAAELQPLPSNMDRTSGTA